MTGAPPAGALRRGRTAAVRVDAATAADLRRRSAMSSRYLLVSLLVVLNLVGVLMVLSASSVVSIQDYGSPWHYFERQVVWLVLGAGAFALALRVSPERLRRLARPAMAVSVVALVAVLGTGRTVGGSARWLGTSSVQIQPSEFAKLAFILFAADILDRRATRGERGEWRYQMGPVLLVFVVIGALVLEQPDMGTTLVIAVIALAMLFTAGLPVRPLGGLVGLAGLASLVLAKAAPYRWRRMTGFLHPFSDQSNANWQAAQGLAALYRGHITGAGLGVSTASYGYLPAPYTDYIFAIVGEETGLTGTVLLSGLFLGLAVLGVRIAAGAKDRFCGLVAAGITAWLVGQAIINIGAVVGLLPVTGVPLPFVSFGGSSLVIALFAAGVLANIATPRPPAPPLAPAPGRRRPGMTPAPATYAVIAGGGTGGHVIPAIAIGEALVAAGHPPASVVFVGSARGMERDLVPAAGFGVTLLPGRGIARRLTLDNVGAVLGLVAAVGAAVVLVGRRRPRVVVSVGGYASVPAVVAALVWRVPLVVAEQNAVPGLANRLAGRFARAAAVPFAGTPLPRAVVTGNPVRPGMTGLDRSPAGRAAARRALGLPDEALVVAASGGSLGSRRINAAVLGVAGRWAGRPGVAIYHVVGERDHRDMAAAAPAPAPGGLVYRQVPFEQRMDLVLTAADVVVGRAGAGTVFELAAAGVASVLVPLPGAPGDHQSANAARMAEAGAAVVVADADLDTDRLESVLADLLGDPRRRVAMGEAASAVARPDAAAAVAALVEANARG